MAGIVQSGMYIITLLVCAVLLTWCPVRAAGSAQVPTQFVVQQATRPGKTRSITFVSSGYQSLSDFRADVQTCVDALYNKSEFVNSEPWPHYAMLLNIYGVYQHSQDLGVSYHHGPLHHCSFLNDVREIEVNNNLDCVLGTPNPHILNCNINKVLRLAAFLPDRDIIVALSNCPELSGVATDGILYITNRPDSMPLMLVHYLNRAVAGLFEEYSLDLFSPNDGELFNEKNCANDIKTALASWGQWYNYDPPTPEHYYAQGCSFAAYVRPTPTSCLMADSRVRGMCKVCRHHLVQALHTPTVSASAMWEYAGQLIPKLVPINFLAGACPPVGSRIVLAAGKDLFISTGIFGAQEDVLVTWSYDGKSHTGPTLRVPASEVSTSKDSFEVTVEVQDKYPSPEDTLPNNTQRAVYSVIKGTCETEKQPCYLESNTSEVENAGTCTECPVNDKHHPPDCDTSVPEYVPVNTIEVIGKSPTHLFSHAQKLAVSVPVSICTALLLGAELGVYYVVIKPRPREILNLHFVDILIKIVVRSCCCVLILLMVIAAFMMASYVPAKFNIDTRRIPTILIGSVVYVTSFLNLTAVLFRWYDICFLCCIVQYVCSGALITLGIYMINSYLRLFTESLSRSLGSMWISSVVSDRKHGTQNICSLQYELKCSGYHASCFMIDSPECPPNCRSNAYVNPCQIPFMDFVSSNYLPSGIVLVLSAFFCSVAGCFNILFYMRYKQLSRTGKLRRRYRKDPTPPVAPITHIEVDIARKHFESASKPGDTLDAAKAIQFLESIFGARLPRSEKRILREKGELTFDGLMGIHFPHMRATATDPRMLLYDEAEHSDNMVELQRKQYAKLVEFAKASGYLSPEQLHLLFQNYAKTRFMPRTKDVLEVVRKEAKNCPDAAMCRGLFPIDLEGLRTAWVTLNPRIVGTLTDDQLDLLFQWSHGTLLPDLAALQGWREKLDVSGKGSIGWGEFCYPYAQRALLQQARDFLVEQESDIPPELIPKSLVLKRYGDALVEKCFLPYEQELPIERLVAFILQDGGGHKGSRD